MACRRLLVLILLLLGTGPVVADDDEAEALRERLVALRRRVIECIDRIEALEKEVADLDLPAPSEPVAAEPSPPEAPAAAPWKGAFAFRTSREHLSLRGGNRATEQAVEDALAWLAAHQAPSGAWEAATFMKWCDCRPTRGPQPDGAGFPGYDVGVTGLALCAFLGAGHSSRGEHPFQSVVAGGLGYLRGVQDPEGCFGPRSTQHYIYNHALATLATVEGYGMSGDPRLQGSAQRGLDFIALARNPYYAWRYGVKPGDSDTSVTGWMALVLQSARLVNEDASRRHEPAPFRIDEEAFDSIKSWIDLMTDPDYGRTGYIQRGGAPARPQALLEKFPGDKSESMTAVGMMARIIVGESPQRSRVIQKGAKLLMALAPEWDVRDGSIDMLYWTWGTQAMFHVGGTWWRLWNTALKKALLPNQRKDTTFCEYKGSWDPIGPWGPDGGRVYSTAMCALCLETYYRYERIKR